MVVHGDVFAEGENGISSETAYGGDVDGEGNRWWYYTDYTPYCCDTPPPPSGSLETAFAKFDKSGDFGTGYVFTSGKKKPGFNPGF